MIHGSEVNSGILHNQFQIFEASFINVYIPAVQKDNETNFHRNIAQQ